MKNISFDCSDCLTDNSEFQTHASLAFQHLLDLAPSDSSLKADVAPQAQGYFATLRISSINGQFVSEAFDQDPFNALTSVKAEAHSQLQGWKSTRSEAISFS